MSDTARLRDVLGRMGRAAVPVDDEDDARDQRDRMLTHIEAAIASTEPRAPTSRRRFAFLAAALVMTLGATWGVRVALEPSVAPAIVATVDRGEGRVTSGDTVRELDAGDHVSVVESDHIETAPASTLRVTFAEATVSMSSDTRVQLASATTGDSIVHVDRGLVAVTVSRLGEARSFTVTTHDSRVVVHGTAFTVQAGRWSRVTVSSGVVAAHHDGRVTFLRAGDSWSSEGSAPSVVARTEQPMLDGVSIPRQGASGPAEEHQAAAASDPTSRVMAQAPRAPTRTGESARAARAAEGAPSARASALHEQNALLRDALAAKRRGDTGSARMLLERLLEDHPRAPIAHEARVEHLRILGAAGDATAATRAARRYLALYPNGYAADEARSYID